MTVDSDGVGDTGIVYSVEVSGHCRSDWWLTVE